MTANTATSEENLLGKGGQPQEPSTPTSDTEVGGGTPTELSEIFFVDNSRRKQSIKIQVKLCPEGVYLRRETDEDDHINEQLIRIDDIIGSRYGPRLKKRARGGLNSCRNPNVPGQEADPEPDSDNSAYLYIYAYLKKEKPLRRVQTLRILRFRSSNDYGVNLQTAELWHHTIRRHKRGNGSSSPADCGKQLLILLNPKSGSGKGRELFQKQVAPLLTEAEVQYDLQITTHPQYAKEFVRTRRDLLERYSGIVVASGDGLFYEVLNGLMERMDWRRACRELPLGIIPCGSGNGLAKSVAHHCNEPYEPKPILHATLTCMAGKSTPMDVVRVELAPRDKHFVMYSFLSVGWGLIADIDIESERLRSIGAQRFTLWAIKRLIGLRSYKGRVSYLLAKGKKEPPVEAAKEAREMPAESDQPKRPSTAAAIRSSLPLNAGEFHDLPEEEEVEAVLDGEQFADAISLDRSVYRQHADSWHSAMSRRTAYYSLGGPSMRSNRSRMSISQRIEAANAEFAERVPTGTIPGLQMPLPSSEGWICEDGDFVMVHAAYTTHLSSDVFFAPESRLDDGLIYLVIIRSGVSRHQLLNFMLSLNTGTHLPIGEDPFIKVVPCRAFRIEPSSSDGILVVDGERVEYGPIQAEVMPGLINVMTTSGQ
ncbi:sphingosine kinase 2 [Drosophila mauritiana]|uniref:sphingosine kinase n=1 Tax=Drosophila mauritiana TaxID=7226 RepID=A0A6P8L9L1_DROMA|nr:sphingosine kinase 2 [Drosophila mauritiana]XP_033172354.1 sphingosine kinase 2 [Drosophila mauritiana]